MNRITLAIVLLHLSYLCYGQSAFNFSQFAEESDSSKQYGNEIALLRKKQTKIINKDRAGRNLKKSIELEQITTINWPWYIYLIFPLIPFVIYLILKKDLTN